MLTRDLTAPREGSISNGAEALGLSNVIPLRRSACLPDVGSGRAGGGWQLPALCRILQQRSRTVCHAEYVEYCGDDDAAVESVGVACGSAAELLDEAAAAGCDTFITGEARFHSALDARGRGMNLILMGHYCSERPAMEKLALEIGHGIRWRARVGPASMNGIRFG